jgi:hypothetical protein
MTSLIRGRISKSRHRVIDQPVRKHNLSFKMLGPHKNRWGRHTLRIPLFYVTLTVIHKWRLPSFWGCSSKMWKD